MATHSTSNRAAHARKRISDESVGYGLAFEGISAADVARLQKV